MSFSIFVIFFLTSISLVPVATKTLESLGDWSPSIETALKVLSQILLCIFFKMESEIFKSVKM